MQQENVKIDGRWAVRYNGEWMTATQRRELRGVQGRREAAIFVALFGIVVMIMALVPPAC